MFAYEFGDSVNEKATGELDRPAAVLRDYQQIFSFANCHHYPVYVIHCFAKFCILHIKINRNNKKN